MELGNEKKYNGQNNFLSPSEANSEFCSSERPKPGLLLNTSLYTGQMRISGYSKLPTPSVS